MGRGLGLGVERKDREVERKRGVGDWKDRGLKGRIEYRRGGNVCEGQDRKGK